MEPQPFNLNDDSGSVDESSVDLPQETPAALPRIIIAPGLRNALILLLIGFVISGIAGIVGIIVAYHQISPYPPGATIEHLGLAVRLIGLTGLCAVIHVILGIAILLLGGRTPLIWLFAVILLLSSFLPFALGQMTKTYLVKSHHLLEDEVDRY